MSFLLDTGEVITQNQAQRFGSSVTRPRRGGLSQEREFIGSEFWTQKQEDEFNSVKQFLAFRGSLRRTRPNQQQMEDRLPIIQKEREDAYKSHVTKGYTESKAENFKNEQFDFFIAGITPLDSANVNDAAEQGLTANPREVKLQSAKIEKITRAGGSPSLGIEMNKLMVMARGGSVADFEAQVRSDELQYQQQQVISAGLSQGRSSGTNFFLGSGFNSQDKTKLTTQSGKAEIFTSLKENTSKEFFDSLNISDGEDLKGVSANTLAILQTTEKNKAIDVKNILGLDRIGLDRPEPSTAFVIRPSSKNLLEETTKQSGYDIDKQIALTKKNFGVDIDIDDIIQSPRSETVLLNIKLRPEAIDLFNRNNNSFEFKSEPEKLQLLQESSGFDITKQLEQTNKRFQLNLGLGDITKSSMDGGLLDEAKTLFARNINIDKLKENISGNIVNTVELNENSDFDTLFGRHENIVAQQKQKIAEIQMLDDDDLRIARIEKEIPQFSARADEISGLITNLEKRVKDTRENRTPQNLISESGLLQSYSLGDLVGRRNQLAKFRNEKTDIFNAIQDPALRQITLEQDIPLLDARIGQLDSDIERSVNFAESREQLNLDIVNAPTKGKRQPKHFTVKLGDASQTFRRNRRGAKQAEQFFNTQRELKLKGLSEINDPVERAVAQDQDKDILDFGVIATKAQSRQLKAEQKLQKRQSAGAVGSSNFLPFTPSDTPSGQLQIQSIPKRKGVPAIFGQLNGLGQPTQGMPAMFDQPKRKGMPAMFDQPKRKGMPAMFDQLEGFGRQNTQRNSRKRQRVDSDNFDLGNVFGLGGTEKIPKRQKNARFDFF